MKAKWITPAVTALDEKEHVDIQANLEIYDFLIKNGMDGILIFGSIGEFFAIPLEEKKALIQAALAHINHRVTVYVGTCHMELETCVELSNYAIEQGADGVMIISPYYFSLPDSALLNFYGTLAQRVKGDVLLYNFPARTGHDLSPDLIYTLVSQYKNIVGIKDTVATMGHTRAIIQKVKKDFPNFKVFSGFDEFFGHNVLSGGDGCVAGLSNFAPDVASGYAEAARADDLEKMAEYQRKIDSMMGIYDVAPQFIPTIKKAMCLRGIKMEPVCAQPLLESTEEEARKIGVILQEAGLL